MFRYLYFIVKICKQGVIVKINDIEIFTCSIRKSTFGRTVLLTFDTASERKCFAFSNIFNCIQKRRVAFLSTQDVINSRIDHT